MRNILIDSELMTDILNTAFNKGLDFQTFEGSLQDEAVIYTDDIRIIKGSPRSKYIILKEEYLNPWSRAVKVIFTVSDKRVDKFIEEREVHNEY